MSQVATPRSGGHLIVGVSGLALSSREAETLEQLQPGGVILFGRNVCSGDQLAALTGAIRRAVPDTLLCVDAEGGGVDRFREVVGRAPAAAWLGAEPPRRAEQAGRWIGHSLRVFDCDVDFAPVVDLDHGTANNALDGRYLGREPRRVTSRAAAFLRGLQGTGVGGCVKHFPGLGSARYDTHHRPASIELDRSALELDLAPFRALSDRAGAVMIAHASFVALDSSATPGTFSAAIATDFLRGELGFNGLVVSDDLEMKALDPWGGLAERTLRAFEAGCDGLPICSRIDEALEVAQFLDRKASADRLQQARERWRVYRDSILTTRENARNFSLETVRRRLKALSQK